MTDTSQYFRCSCGSEVLNLDWLDADKRGLCISVFDQRMGRSLWWKLKTCWRVLREGSPWGDQVILQEDELKRLSSFFEAYGRRKRRERTKADKQIQKLNNLIRSYSPPSPWATITDTSKFPDEQCPLVSSPINDTLKKLIVDNIATNQANSAEIRRRINDFLGDAPAE